MPQTLVQCGILLIDDHIFLDEGDALSEFKQFISELTAKYETQIFGLTLTRNRQLASNPGYYQDHLGPRIRLISTLVLPAAGKAARGRGWAELFGAGLEDAVASMLVRKDVRMGLWYYVDSRSSMLMEPLELVYWVLLFTGFNPLFMRRVVHFSGGFIECPSHPSASDIIMRKGRDYRDILLMSLVSIYSNKAHSPYKIAKVIEEVLGYPEYGSADSLRKTVMAVLRCAASYCLVSFKKPASYTISPFGKLLLDVLLSNSLVRYIEPRNAATFIENVMSADDVK
jgi:hypothetical protein